MNDPLMDWANKSAKEQLEYLRGLIGQLEKANIEQHGRYAALIERLDQLKAENQRLNAENAGLREERDRFKAGVDRAIDLIVQLENIIDRAAGDREYRGELIDDLRSAIDVTRGLN